MLLLDRAPGRRWNGDYGFLLQNLIVKDFKIRYRNMSLGVLWSLVNPLVMMSVLTFVFTKVLPNNAIPNFPVFVMCGLVPFNFFTVAWVTGTTSLLDGASLVKRVPIPREIIPISTVLANGLHFLIQISLLLLMASLSGLPVNRYWLLLIPVFGLEIVFVCGMALISSALNVFIWDVRYVVESANSVLFWLVPIVYSFAIIPQEYREIYQYNPVAAVVMACRSILLEGKAPAASILIKLTWSSCLMLALGFGAFRLLRRKFFDYL